VALAPPNKVIELLRLLRLKNKPSTSSKKTNPQKTSPVFMKKKNRPSNPANRAAFM